MFDCDSLAPCAACGGEGRDIRCGIVYEAGCGHPHRGDVDHGICLHCNGTGEMPTEAAAGLDDLEERCGDHEQAAG